MRIRRRRTSWLAPTLVALIACAALAGEAAAATSDAQRFVAVGWSDPVEPRGWVQRFATREPWAFDGDAIPVGRNPTLRFAGGRLYAVSDLDATIVEIDCTSWSATRSYTLRAGSEPLDIAVVAPPLAYVTTRSSSSLLALDLETGAVRSALDFAELDLPIGALLVPGMMAIDAGRLFVQLSRFDALAVDAPGAAEPSGFVAVVDVATEKLVDADPQQAGTQAIALQGTFPKYKMSLLRDERRLYLSASGAFFDEGGLEAID
ncbi:MAG TPA: hypothetical protein VEC18_10400, partial [Myxococcota bacterium]|nr:hypothetical protein [Myxococcota bacterium]